MPDPETRSTTTASAWPCTTPTATPSRTSPSGTRCRRPAPSSGRSSRPPAWPTPCRPTTTSSGPSLTSWPRCSGLKALRRPAAVLDVIHDDVLAELGGVGKEDAALVDLGQRLHEARHDGLAVQHEGVHGDTVAAAALHLAQRVLHSLAHAPRADVPAG